jgi:hypothetical protein
MVSNLEKTLLGTRALELGQHPHRVLPRRAIRLCCGSASRMKKKWHPTEATSTHEATLASASAVHSCRT